jgi:hypothetical protein
VDFYHNSSLLIGVDSMKLTPGEIGAIAEELRAGLEAASLKGSPIRPFRLKTPLKRMKEWPAVREERS